MNAFQNPPWSWTPLAPILCAVHCAAMPLLVAFAPAFALLEALEVWFLGITVMIAALALSAGIRSHGMWVVAAPVAIGLGLWSASLGGVFAPVPEEATTAGSTLVVASGLFWNTRVHRAGANRACPCPRCDEERESGKEDVRSRLAGSP